MPEDVSENEEAERAAAATRISTMYRGKQARIQHKQRRQKPAASLPSMKPKVIDVAEKLLEGLRRADDAVNHINGMRRAKALVFVTQLRSGAELAASASAGFIICRLADTGWSAPLSLGSEGTGMGHGIGGKSPHFVISLSEDDAVAELVRTGEISFASPVATDGAPATLATPKFEAFSRGPDGKYGTAVVDGTST